MVDLGYECGQDNSGTHSLMFCILLLRPGGDHVLFPGRCDSLDRISGVSRNSPGNELGKEDSQKTELWAEIWQCGST